MLPLPLLILAGLTLALCVRPLFLSGALLVMLAIFGLADAVAEVAWYAARASGRWAIADAGERAALGLTRLGVRISLLCARLFRGA